MHTQAKGTSLAFIGAGRFDAAAVAAELDACLLADHEWDLYTKTPDDEQRGWNFGEPALFQALRPGQQWA